MFEYLKASVNASLCNNCGATKDGAEASANGASVTSGGSIILLFDKAISQTDPNSRVTKLLGSYFLQGVVPST